MFTCLNPHKPTHQHALTSEARECWGLRGPATAPSGPVVAPSTASAPPAPAPCAVPATAPTAKVVFGSRHNPDGPLSEPQYKYISDLKGDLTYALTLSYTEASAYITTLKGGSMTSPAPAEKSARDRKLEMVAALMASVDSGYYAVREEEGAAVFFMRVSKPTKGKYIGSIKIQKVIGSGVGTRLEEAAVYWPSGQWSIYSNIIIEKLMLLVADTRSALLLYGKEIGRCCRCNAELTDSRSRHYSIGPECEKHWPHILYAVDEINEGRDYETLVHLGLAERR